MFNALLLASCMMLNSERLACATTPQSTTKTLTGLYCEIKSICSLCQLMNDILFQGQTIQ